MHMPGVEYIYSQGGVLLATLIFTIVLHETMVLRAKHVPTALAIALTRMNDGCAVSPKAHPPVTYH